MRHNDVEQLACKPKERSRAATAVGVVSFVVLVGGCSAQNYKNEIAEFKTSVDSSVNAFEALRNEQKSSVIARAQT